MSRMNCTELTPVTVVSSTNPSETVEVGVRVTEPDDVALGLALAVSEKRGMPEGFRVSVGGREPRTDGVGGCELSAVGLALALAESVPDMLRVALRDQDTVGRMEPVP